MTVDPSKKRGPAEPPILPGELAAALEASIKSDHETRTLLPDPEGADALLAMGRKLPLGSPEATLARWAKPLGIEAELGIEKGARLSMEALAAKVAEKISPHPERFAELAAAAQEFEAYLLRREGALLQTCGTPWGRIVRLFWQDRKGRTVMRQRGLHSCKHRWCPRCGKPRQNRLANEIERSTELARAWGFGENNMRFLTVTIPNGKDVSELRQEAHQAWARLQRTRWWPRNVFGWFRGTEVVTGTDGHWNLHLHVVLILWAHQISYSSLWEAWEKAVGKRCQIDVVTLADYRRKAKGRGTTRAARYIVKYITKREVLTNLRNGPGGLAHLFSATRRLRAFAVGGGCSVLRRMLPVLMPAWALRAERALAGAELRDGLAPIHAEEVDPETGEAFDIPPPVPFPDPHERAAWTTLAARLADDEGTVGQKCGPRGRFRRIGEVPLRSRGRTVKDELANKALDGLRAIVARGDWRVFDCENIIKVYRKDASGKRVATGETKRRSFRAVLPGIRFAWKSVSRAVWAALLGDATPWGALRRAAFRAFADGKVEPYAQENHMRALGAALDDRVTLRYDNTVESTTKRAIHARDLMHEFVKAVQRDGKAVWDQAVQNLRTHALALGQGSLLELEPVNLRALRAAVEAEAGF